MTKHHSSLSIRNLLFFLFIFNFYFANASYILINMDEQQSNHLKAYGIAYISIEKEIDVKWLLNYKGGSFLIKASNFIEEECKIRNVSYSLIADLQSNRILSEISKNDVNQEIIRLEKAPRIAIYSPKNKQPWDDAVTLALSYAEIPYDVIYDDEVLNNLLPLYDWLHLHHEDFTGQYGKFYASFKNASWYKEQKKSFENDAKNLGFDKVSQVKLAVAKKIKEYVLSGGFLFAMCSATDSYDIALASEGVDICHHMFDGDPIENDINNKLDFSKTLAFKNFELVQNPNKYEFSSIDATQTRRLKPNIDFFTLFELFAT